MEPQIKREFFQKTMELKEQNKTEFCALLNEVDSANDNNFQVAVQYAVKHCDLTPEAFMDQFGISRGTVSRWINGKSLPHPMMRPVIISWIQNCVKEGKIIEKKPRRFSSNP